MNRTIEYKIGDYEQPVTIAGFLRARAFSSKNLTDLKHSEGSVLVNGKPAFLNRKLNAGDVLTIHIVEEEVSKYIPPVNLPLDIIYEDEDFLVLNKPAGMPIHTSLNNYENTLANALAYYFQTQNKPFVYRCVNRLDRDTSGLTIVAKHRVSAGILGSMVAAKSNGVYEMSGQDIPGGASVRNLTKNSLNIWEEQPVLYREYLAIVRGILPEKEGTIDAGISRKDGSIIERQIDLEHGERAVTHYKVLDQKDGYSLLSLFLETGRTHQIRVHLKYLGYPLIGDYLYNPDMEKITRQALHSYRLVFLHPISGKKMEFVGELPEDMAAFGFSLHIAH